MDALERIREVLQDEPLVWFARLYGSRGRGEALRSDSDWDVAVYVDEALNGQQRFDLRRRLSAALAGPGTANIDLLVLNDAPPLLALRALQGRSLLDRAPRAYVRFFTRVMGEADDDRHFHATHARVRRQRLQEGRFGRP